MKIIFVNSCEYFGGAEMWHLRTALWLRGQGHEVKMLLRDGPLAEKSLEKGLQVKTFPMAFDLDVFSFLGSWFYFLKEKPDLILLNDQRECRLIAPAALLSGVKTRLQRKGWPFLKGSWRDRLVYGFFITDLMAVSGVVAKIFAEKSGLSGKRIKIIPNGTDIEKFSSGDRDKGRKKLGLSRDQIVIGTAGRLVSQKGFDVMLEAAAILKKKDIKVMWAIAGVGEQEDELKKLSTDLGLSEFVVFCGQVDDMPSFLASLDVFVFPSRMEGRSNALTEAVAAGLPIVATDIPGDDELIEHGENGLLVPSESPESIALEVEKLISDKELSSRLANCAREYGREKLDSRKILVELESYLMGLVQRDGKGLS